MHSKNNDGDLMEPWDIISKVLETMTKDHKYWEKEEIVETKPICSFLVNAKA